MIIGDRARYEQYMPDTTFARGAEKVYVDRGAGPEEILAAGRDAECIMADAMSRVPRAVIEGMPRLRLIHSEGVGYNGIDIEAARERGIPVCNNKGCNDAAVAEQAVLLMLGILRTVVTGDAAVRAGEQIVMKERRMVEGITELGECRVGLIGFGDIGRATAHLLHAFGCEVVYNTRHRADPEVEDTYHARWVPREELLSTCDIVSLHAPVTAETTGMMGDEAFALMKKTAVLINTARGELVDNGALVRALETGRIAAAGLDTVAPEPVTAENPLLTAPEAVKAKILFSPHLGGITTATFYRCHGAMWRAAEVLEGGGVPANIVNR